MAGHSKRLLLLMLVLGLLIATPIDAKGRQRRKCISPFHSKVEITDSLEANKEPDESISFYEPSLYTLTRLMNYQKFHPQGYSPRLTIYFYAAAALFFLMLIFWLIKSFIVSPFKKKTV